MNYKARIKHVLNSVVKATDFRNKLTKGFLCVAEREHPTTYESAWQIPSRYSYVHVRRVLPALMAACGGPVELENRGGAVIVRIITKDIPKEVPIIESDLRPDRLLIGYDRLRKPVYHPLSTHLLAGGASGAGKTDWLRFVLYQLILQGYDIRIVDMKGFSFMPFDTIPGITVARDLEEAAVLLKAAYVELVEREKAVIRYRNRSIIQTFQPIAVIIDEAAQIAPSQNSGEDRKLAKICDAYCARISQKGREPRVQLIYCTQRPDAEIINAQVKANVEAAIAFRCKTEVNSRIILDRQGAEEISPETPGRCIYAGIRDVMVQVPFVGDDDAWNELLIPLKTEVMDGGSSRRIPKDPRYGTAGNDEAAGRTSRQLESNQAGIGNIKAIGARWSGRKLASGDNREGVAAHAEGAKTGGLDAYDATLE